MALRNNRSLTYYQTPSILPYRKVTSDNAGGIISAPGAQMTYSTGATTTAFNNQAYNYLSFNQRMQQDLLNRTQTFMEEVYRRLPSPGASQLRDHSTWAHVKRFVTREELMKLQIGGKADLPLNDQQLSELRTEIAGKDLTSMSDKDIESIIDNIIRPDDRQYLEALKNFKMSGESSDLLQSSKLNSLRKELESVDLDHISSDQYKRLKENYFERPEYHHKESISSDPSKQSNADNIDILNTTEHDKRHTIINDQGEETVSYKTPVKENPNNRNQEIQDANSERVFKNELRGIGLVAAIGAGIGFTIGFICTLAQNGINPDSLRCAAASGLKSGLESGVLSVAGHGIGRTIGEVASQAITRLIGNIGITVTENIGKMISMGVVGTLTIVLFSAYQFIKLKSRGLGVKEALIKTGKQALFSLSILTVSIAAQGVWGGAAGIIVSISAGFIMITYSVIDSIHQRHFSDYIRVYTINKCYPNLPVYIGG